MPLEFLVIPGLVFLILGFLNGKKAYKKLHSE